ncbi:MAG: hypothetical protein OCD00_17550 [Colwellia sp.]
MGNKIFHQAGHCTNWNVDSWKNDSVGHGLIFSPVHEPMNKLAKHPEDLKKQSLFDPQYYLPSSQKKKLQTYPFFPETICAGGFQTVDFNALAIESARQCVAFQLEQNFESIIIPARFFEQLDPEYINKQNELSLQPFLKAIDEYNVIGTKDIYLTLPITSFMLESDEFKYSLLNWVTNYPEISGIYLICQCERKTKQICDSEFLFKYMEVMKLLSDVGLKVLVGYSNSESLLYTITGPTQLTLGAYENTRIFSLDKFVVSDEERRGPKARIYVPGLQNWIKFEQAKQIKEAEPNFWSKIFVETEYSEQAFKQTKDPAFNSPILYKHYFKVFSEQLNAVTRLNGIDRYKEIRKLVKEAINNHELVEDIPIDLDSHGNGQHLQPWLDAINKYYREYLKT